MKRKKRDKARDSDPREAGRSDPSGSRSPLSAAVPASKARRTAVLAACAVAAAFLWAYWPTLTILAGSWTREADYSHGFLVVPLAAYFVWARRRTFPGLTAGFAWPGIVLLLLSAGLRLVSARYYVDAVDGWSIVVWAAGVVWLLGGWRLLRWSWPSVVFLFFMVPLPWRGERMFSLPLQTIATKLSCWFLQCLGQPAIAEGNTIWVNELQLEIEQACSGLRIFIAIIALAFVYLVLFPRPWWQRGLLAVSVVPVALLANATRIVSTAVVLQHVSTSSQAFAHDLVGWLTLPLAVGLFALALWYSDHLVREVEVMDVGTVARQMMD